MPFTLVKSSAFLPGDEETVFDDDSKPGGWAPSVTKRTIKKAQAEAKAINLRIYIYI